MNRLWLGRAVRLAIGSLGITGGLLVGPAPAAQAQDAHCRSTPPAVVGVQPRAECRLTLECPADVATLCQWVVLGDGSALVAPGGMVTSFEFTFHHGSVGVGEVQSCGTMVPVAASCTAVAQPSAFPGALFDVICVVRSNVVGPLVNPAVTCASEFHSF
jgi:hypothetical protein